MSDEDTTVISNSGLLDRIARESKGVRAVPLLDYQLPANKVGMKFVRVPKDDLARFREKYNMLTDFAAELCGVHRDNLTPDVLMEFLESRYPQM